MSENGNGAKPSAPRVLDLDALYGVDEPLTITWQGKTYELLRPQALGPRALVLVNSLQRRMNALEGADENMVTDAQADELGAAVAQVLRVICPTLDAAAMPFPAQLRTLAFYTEETQSAADEKKIQAQAKVTPAKRSRH